MRAIRTHWNGILVMALSLTVAGCGGQAPEEETEGTTRTESGMTQTQEVTSGSAETKAAPEESDEASETKPKPKSPEEKAAEESPEKMKKQAEEAAEAAKKETEAKQAGSADGASLYQTRCATCHGPKGKGEGILAQTLKPKPRDHTNPEWQDSVTDEEIAKTIKEGGQAVGLKATMPAHPDLTDAEVQALVDYIRSLRSEG